MPRILFWILSRLRWRYLRHLLLTLLLAGALLLPPQLFQYFATALHAPASAGPHLVGHLLAFGAAIALTLSLLTYLNALSRESLQLRIESLLRVAATERLLTVPLETFDGLQRGELLTRLGNDLTRVETFVASSLPQHLRYLATMGLAAALFLWQCGPLAVIPLAVVLGAAGLNFIGQKKLRPLLEELRTLHAGVYQDMLQSFEAVRTIRTHGAGRSHLERFRGLLRDMARRSLRVVALAGCFDGANILSYEIMMALCLAFAAWRVLGGQMAFHTALTFPFYLGFFYSSAESLAGGIGEWNRFFVDSRRLGALLPELGHSVPLAPPGAPASDGLRLHARDLRIGYHGRPLTDCLRFSLEKGKTVVVVGPSGCGKSTLLEVVAGLRSPVAGAVTSESPGCEFITASATRDLCAVVEQRACLWSGTVRGNLILECTSAVTDDTLWEVLASVGLQPAIAAAGGLEARVDDRGLNFSEGQRYRLALARALLLPRPFLLLDEPFAALDAESIATVVTAINTGKRERGYLIVTHQIPPGLAIDGVMDFRSFSLFHQNR